MSSRETSPITPRSKPVEKEKKKVAKKEEKDDNPRPKKPQPLPRGGEGEADDVDALSESFSSFSLSIKRSLKILSPTPLTDEQKKDALKNREIYSNYSSPTELARFQAKVVSANSKIDELVISIESIFIRLREAIVLRDECKIECMKREYVKKYLENKKKNKKEKAK